MQAMLERIAAQAGASPEEFEIVQESDFRRYLRGAWPDWTVKDLDEVEAKLRKVEINSIPLLLVALKRGLNDLLKSEDETGLSPEILHGLKMQEHKGLPIGRPSVRRKAAAASAGGEKGQEASRTQRTAQQASTAVAGVQAQRVGQASSAVVGLQGQGAGQASTSQLSGLSRGQTRPPVPQGGQLFRVSGLVSGRQQAGIHEKPSLASAEIGGRAWGDMVVAEAETFDGWAKLAGEPGWMLRVLQKKEGPQTLLAPQGDLDKLASVELSDAPGPRRFEVVSRSGIEVRTAPSSSSQARGRREFGEEVFAESQTYDGWVRLVGGAGWLPSFSPEEGPLLLCPLFEQKGGWREQRGLASQALRAGPLTRAGAAGAVLEEVRAALRTASAAREERRLRAAILGAKAWGVEASEIREAELLAEGLRRGWAGPAREGPSRGAPLGGGPGQAEDAAARAAALERLARAAAAGEGVEAKAAREAAVRAGVPKKEIARVFALHSGGGATA